MKVTLADWKPTPKQIKLVNKVLKSGRLTYGKYTRELEEKFAKKHNFKYAIFTNSGTSALQVAWHCLKEINGWKDGDEVIVPSVTFVATLNVIIQNGLKPVLVDVDYHSYNMDPYMIEGFITERTVAICPVDLLGRPCEINFIKKLAKEYKLKIVEDSCETMFVKHKNGKIVGSEADIACYSSYMAHIISTGVGGFICTNSKKYEQVSRSLIWHGRDKYYLSIDDNNKDKKELLKKRYLFNRIGYSYRLTEIEAAIGIDEVNRSEEIIKKRKENAELLYRLLATLYDYIELPDIFDDNAWMFFPIKCKQNVRNRLCLFLEKNGIQTRYIMPLTYQPCYEENWTENDFPMAHLINENALLVGVHHFLKKSEIKYLANKIIEFFTSQFYKDYD